MPPRLRILSIAPTGGDIGGATVASRVLHGELARREDVYLIAVDSHRFKHGRIGQLLSGAVVLAALLCRVASTQVIVLHASVGGLELLGPAIATIGRMSRRPVVLRAFGGSMDHRIVKRPRTYTYLIAHSTILVEPRATVKGIEERFPGSRVHWFANHRPMNREKPEIPGSEAQFAYFGRINSQKVLDLLVRAVPHASSQWTVDLYGPVDGDPEAGTGLPDRAQLKGLVAHDRVPETMSRYTATVLPTSYSGEGYPGAVLESFVARTPVVASRWRFIPEIVQDGVNGLLFEPDDPEGLAQALDCLATDCELVERLREGARQSAAEFDSERWASRFVDICREAVGLDPQSTSER